MLIGDSCKFAQFNIASDLFHHDHWAVMGQGLEVNAWDKQHFVSGIYLYRTLPLVSFSTASFALDKGIFSMRGLTLCSPAILNISRNSALPPVALPLIL